MDKLIIIGAGGHGRVVADTVKRGGVYEQIAFLDDVAPAKSFPYTYLGKIEEFTQYADTYDVFVAIGNNQIRRKITEKLKKNSAKFATIIDPSAIIGSDVSAGAGSVILSRAVVNTGSRIGEGVIINTASVLDHDCKVGDFCHIAVGGCLGGAVHVGDNTWIDAGVAVKTHVHICRDCKIEVGSAVNCDLEEPGTYCGIYAKKKDCL